MAHRQVQEWISILPIHIHVWVLEGQMKITNGLITGAISQRKLTLKTLQIQQLNQVQNKLNNRPRKVLGYKTPAYIAKNLNVNKMQAYRRMSKIHNYETFEHNK